MNLLSCYVVFRWEKTTKIYREKKQAVILLISGFLSITAGWIVDYIALSNNLEQLSSSTTVIWVLCLIYVIKKYRFMQLTPANVSIDIIANIEESIILLDCNLRIITFNQCAQETLHRKKSDLLNKTISDIISEHESLTVEIRNLSEDKTADFTSPIHFKRKDDTLIPMDIKCSRIKDRHNDLLGILIVGREAKELIQLQELYKITERETDVIRQIINGHSNKEIAANLDVTVRTIKAHITSIYKKLNINNKVQLMMLLYPSVSGLSGI